MASFALLWCTGEKLRAAIVSKRVTFGGGRKSPKRSESSVMGRPTSVQMATTGLSDAKTERGQAVMTSSITCSRIRFGRSTNLWTFSAGIEGSTG